MKSVTIFSLQSAVVQLDGAPKTFLYDLSFSVSCTSYALCS